MIPSQHRIHERNHCHHHDNNIITIGKRSISRRHVVERGLRLSTTPSQHSQASMDSTLPDTSRPLPPHTFGGMVERALIERFGEKDVERILISWRLLDQEYYRKEYVGDQMSAVDGLPPPKDSDMIQECHSYVPGLSIRPFWNPNDFDWAMYLESHYPEIRKEFDAVTANMEQLQQDGNNVWAGALTDDAASYGEGWKTLVLMDRGRWDPVNANLFPKTASKLFFLLSVIVPLQHFWFSIRYF